MSLQKTHSQPLYIEELIPVIIKYFSFQNKILKKYDAFLGFKKYNFSCKFLTKTPDSPLEIENSTTPL
jgi:hypothetical protein